MAGVEGGAQHPDALLHPVGGLLEQGEQVRFGLLPTTGVVGASEVLRQYVVVGVLRRKACDHTGTHDGPGSDRCGRQVEDGGGGIAGHHRAERTDELFEQPSDAEDPEEGSGQGPEGVHDHVGPVVAEGVPETEQADDGHGRAQAEQWQQKGVGRRKEQGEHGEGGAPRRGERGPLPPCGPPGGAGRGRDQPLGTGAQTCGHAGWKVRVEGRSGGVWHGWHLASDTALVPMVTLYPSAGRGCPRRSVALEDEEHAGVGWPAARGEKRRRATGQRHQAQ